MTDNRESYQEISESDIRIWHKDYLSGQIQRRLNWHEWDIKDGQVWSAIQNLRMRANAARWWAAALFAVVVIIGVVGALFIFDPWGLLSDRAETTERDSLRLVAIQEENDLADLVEDFEDDFYYLKETIDRDISSNPWVRVSLPSLENEPFNWIDELGNNEFLVTTEHFEQFIRDGDGEWRYFDFDGKLSSRICAINFDPTPHTLTCDGRLFYRNGTSGEWIKDNLNPLFFQDEEPEKLVMLSSGLTYVVGDGGTIFGRQSASEDWERTEIPSISSMHSDFEIYGGVAEEIFILFDKGEIYSRVNLNEGWQKQHLSDVNSKNMPSKVYVGKNGETMLYGNGQSTWSRQELTAVWVEQDVKTRFLRDEIKDIYISASGDGVMITEKGRIYARPSNSSAWKHEKINNPRYRKNDVGLNVIFETSLGEIFVIGDEGTIFSTSSLQEDWYSQSIDTGANFVDIDEMADGTLLIAGDPGTLLTRSPDEWRWRVGSWLDRSGNEKFWDVHAASNGEVFAVGWENTLLTYQPVPPTELQSISNLDELSSLVTNLDGYLDQISWRNSIRNLRMDSLELETARARIEAKKAAATAGSLDREEQLGIMTTFLISCRGWPFDKDGKPTGDGSKEVLDSCVSAYERATVDNGGAEWYKYVSERVTPALLLVFLLATVGAGYRYNLRMAAFYDGRADALTLWARHFEAAQTGTDTPDTSDDSSATPDLAPKLDELIKLIEAFSGEKTTFQEPKTPIDNVTDLAKGVIEKLNPRSLN